MPTPVGPAPGDPNDADLWDEWFDPDDEEVPRSRFGWPVRVLAIVIAISIALLLIFAG
jgi:hypothetical protein